MPLLQALQNPALFDHPVTHFEVIETHISWVLLTGPYAYKIKKPVNFGFLDFSTLEKRKYYCQEELRLNRRLAPQLYLDVIRLCGTEARPRLNADGAVFEYAVKMHQFDQAAQLDRLLATHGLAAETIDQLANTVARFHLKIDVVESDSPYGDTAHVAEPILENFVQIRRCIQDKDILTLLDVLEHWSEQQLDLLQATLSQRKQQGFVRECHGDMHLRNMALIDDEIVIFDCIEFNKNLYFIDVMSEIAFLIMDLEDRQQDLLARQFLNRYLEITGDYAGLSILTFYKVYRAMVRAKVDALRSKQERAGSKEFTQTYQDFCAYLQLAERYTRPTPVCLLINHGLSGSGKSVGTRQLLGKFPAIVLRSDVERKRLHQQDIQQHHISAPEQGIYSQPASEKTYHHLTSLARTLLMAGVSVIIDAANLKKQQRALFCELASSLACPYVILNYQAGHDTLRQRVTQRLAQQRDASDATLAVLEQQIKNQQPLSQDERHYTIDIDSEQALDIENIVDKVVRLSAPTA